MTDYTKPISSSNPPESRGKRNQEIKKVEEPKQAEKQPTKKSK